MTSRKLLLHILNDIDFIGQFVSINVFSKNNSFQ